MILHFFLDVPVYNNESWENNVNIFFFLFVLYFMFKGHKINVQDKWTQTFSLAKWQCSTSLEEDKRPPL